VVSIRGALNPEPFAVCDHHPCCKYVFAVMPITRIMNRVGQNRTCTPYMTVCMVTSLLKMPYIHRVYVCVYGFGQP